MGPLASDDVFELVAKAIFGDAIEPGELRKSLDGADVHVDGPVNAKKEKRLAYTGLATTGVAGVGGLHALKATKTEAVQRAAKVKEGTYEAGRVARALHIRNPGRAAAAATLGWSALHGAELVGDSLGARAQTRAIREAREKEPTSKGFRIAMRPAGARRVGRPTLKAKRPAGAPAPVAKGLGESWDADVAIARISKSDEKRQVFGWANISTLNGVEVVDLQGDYVPVEELEKAAYKYVLDCRVGGDQHQRVAKSDTVAKHTSDLIESMVFTDEKCQAMGLPDDFPRGWWIGMQVQDPETWQLIKEGKRTGFSVHGAGRREDYDLAKAAPRRELAAKLAIGATAAGGTTVAVGMRRDRRQRRASEQWARTHAPTMALEVQKGADVVRRDRTPTPKKQASAAVSSIGYDRPTRHLAVAFTSAPGRTYDMRARPKTALALYSAKSQGRYFNSHLKGRSKQWTGPTTADRVRTAVHRGDQ